MRRGIVDLPLHYGSSPRWLFEKMVRLSKEISKIIVYEFGQDEFLKRLSDPFWFQGFACVIGFDWHSSGTTTVTCGALKEALKTEDLGIYITGGKAQASRKTPQEIADLCEKINLSDKRTNQLIKASKLSAKVDNSCLQDGFQLYHHSFILTENGKWAVIQQGLNSENKYARRYHWLSEKVKSYINEPHAAVCCDISVKPLNMVANESENCRKCSVEIVKDFTQNTLLERFSMPKHHKIYLKKYNFLKSKRIMSNLRKAYETQPKNYEELISIKGLGAETIRALALISELVYGEKPSWKDPVKYSFAHGGKSVIKIKLMH